MPRIPTCFGSLKASSDNSLGKPPGSTPRAETARTGGSLGTYNCDRLGIGLSTDRFIWPGWIGMKRPLDPVEQFSRGGRGRLLVARQLSFAAATFGCMLALCCVRAAEVAAPGPQDAQAIGQGGVVPIAPVPSETHGGPSPELPEIAP